MRKPRSYAEVYNDLDGDVVSVFRVLRDPVAAARLQELLTLTPFARDEFVAAHRGGDVDAIEHARRAIVRSFMGFGSASFHAKGPRGMRTRASSWTSGKGTGFRANSQRSGTTPAHDWSRYPELLPLFVDRLRGVVIENRCGLEVVTQHDRAETLIYADPPYPFSTRDDNRSDYGKEMSDDDHRALAVTLRAARGMVVLSGYPCALYDAELFPDWERHEREHMADGARRRVEVVWLNPACVRARRMDRSQGELLAEASG
jgi:DNA adenine methylase